MDGIFGAHAPYGGTKGQMRLYEAKVQFFGFLSMCLALEKSPALIDIFLANANAMVKLP